MVKGYNAREAILAKAFKSVLIEFAKGVVFSEYTALAERYGAGRNGLGSALCIVDVAALHHTAQ
jgi:hypothetical protein